MEGWYREEDPPFLSPLKNNQCPCGLRSPSGLWTVPPYLFLFHTSTVGACDPYSGVPRFWVPEVFNT